MCYRVFKRVFDFVSALLLFGMISPLFLVLMIMVRFMIGSPIFFTQERSGLNQNNFFIKKFRSMTNEKDSNGNLLPDDQRLTKFGCFLRSSSLDELPELLSIIKGDMSVIGPRPLPPTYNKFYSERELKRFDVRSGLIPPDSTDDDAIISWDKQLEYEADYADSLSFMKDIKIFFAVFKTIFNRNKTNYGGYVRKALHEERDHTLIDGGLK